MLDTASLEDYIRSLIAKYGIEDHTTIYINSDNIPSLLDNADIYLSTSLFEGLSNSILEAMNADLPVVATNVGDNSYMVKHGHNGYLASIGDFRNLGDYILSLANDADKRLNMGRRSKELLEAHFTGRKFTDNYLVYISSFLKNDKK